MNRSRRLLVLALMLAPAIAKAQQPARIAWVGSRSERDMAVNFAAFKQGLRENGLIEGKHYVLDARWADGHYELFPEMVDDLLSRKPAVMMVNTIASVRVAQQATKTVPLVMMSTNDPVGVGLIASLVRLVVGSSPTRPTSFIGVLVVAIDNIMTEMRDLVAIQVAIAS